MRVLVISDVHGNLEALDAVLADAGAFDRVWSLGDLVGYGPQPNECIERLREFEHVAIAGNHDWGALGKLDLAEFNVDARQANLWTRERLTPRSWSFLDSLPEMLVEGRYTLAHGSPRHPIWEYIVYASVACQNFSFFQTGVCLVGHTHLPAIFVGPGEGDGEAGDCHVVPPLVGEGVTLGEERTSSTRQCRPATRWRRRAAYLLLDTHRHHGAPPVAYDIEAVQGKMRAAACRRAASPGWSMAGRLLCAGNPGARRSVYLAGTVPQPPITKEVP